MHSDTPWNSRKGRLARKLGIYTSEVGDEKKGAVVKLLIVFAIAIVGGLVGTRVGLPQGALLGSLLAVSIVNSTSVFQSAKLPAPLLFLMYILIGIELGAGVDRSTLSALGKAWLPTVLLMILLLIATVGFALVVTRVFSLNLATALFGASPGAVSGITAMGAAVGANIPVVVAMHTVRVTVLLLAIPWIYNLLAD